jgi:DNA-binding transcriptional MerR regulator
MDDRDIRMTIGDFSRATRLSAKALRFYHAEGILVPASLDPANGYRLYSVDQLGDAQVIRTLRELGLGLDDVRAVLAAPDVTARAAVLTAHADRLEAQLQQTRASLGALRRMLEPPAPHPPISYRRVPATTAFAIQESIDLSRLGEWFRPAADELTRFAQSSGVAGAGPLGGLWPDALFVEGRGVATLYVPVPDGTDDITVRGRVRRIELPAVELAVATSVGPDENVPAVYAALGEHVARHELGIDAPVRETYLRGLPGDADATVEIGWPVFRVGR